MTKCMANDCLIILKDEEKIGTDIKLATNESEDGILFLCAKHRILMLEIYKQNGLWKLLQSLMIEYETENWIQDIKAKRYVSLRQRGAVANQLIIVVMIRDQLKTLTYLLDDSMLVMQEIKNSIKFFKDYLKSASEIKFI